METFVLYASALALAYWFAKAVLTLVLIVATFCLALVLYIARDVANMLRIRKARRERH